MTKSYEELIADMSQIIAQVHERAFGMGYEQGKAEILQPFKEAAEKLAEDSRKITPVNRIIETPQQARDRIVEQAKADVAELINDYQLSSEEIEFAVDKEKRTVIAEVKHIFSGKILAKGIAKCAPGDCFNVHIGKAIALRRALGLEVPVEYTSTPQPTEVRVGDKIRLKLRSRFLNGNIETVSGFYRENKPLTLESPGHIYEDQYEIIDDSREGVTQ